MILFHTRLTTADNSGAKLMQCIKILKNTNTAYLGDQIVISIKAARPNSKVKKGEVNKALIVRTKKKVQREDGSAISFNTNAAIIVNTALQPVGSRVLGPIAEELRTKKHLRIISLAERVI